MARGTTRRAGSGRSMVRYSTFLRHDQIEALRAAYYRHGVTPAEQIRRALDVALGTKPSARRRA